MVERKRMALEPDSLEEQEFRKSFEVEYNRSFEMPHQDSLDGQQQTLRVQQERLRGQPSSDLESQPSFDNLPTLREHDRPSFDLPEEDQFLRDRQNFFSEGVSDSLDLGTSTDTDAPPPPKRAPRKGGKSPAMLPAIISERFKPPKLPTSSN